MMKDVDGNRYASRLDLVMPNDATNKKHFCSAGGMFLDEDPDAPERFAVWLPIDSGFDIIGAGATAAAALLDARKTISGWNRNHAEVNTAA